MATGWGIKAAGTAPGYISFGDSDMSQGQRIKCSIYGSRVEILGDTLKYFIIIFFEKY